MFVATSAKMAMRGLSSLARRAAPKVAIARRSGGGAARHVASALSKATPIRSPLRSFPTRSLGATSGSAFRAWQPRMFVAGSMVAAWCALHYYAGTSHEMVYEHRFITDADPEDMAEFYGAEDFMEIMGVLPFVARAFLRSAEFDEDGVAHAYGLPGQLDIELTFDQDEKDTNGDGEPDTTIGFNKNMKWNDIEPFSGGSLWSMDHDFGFRQLDDGKYEVYHVGQKYYGPYPLYLLWKLHSYYVIRATEFYLNHPLFSAEDQDDEREHLRVRLPFAVFLDTLASRMSPSGL